MTLTVVALGWMGAGVVMALMVPTARPAIQDFLDSGAIPIPVAPGSTELEIRNILTDQWFSYLMAAFLLGAAAGGWLFGWMADRWGRGPAMAASIACYSLVTALSYWAPTPMALLALRFVACLGVGGMWPCGVALLSEHWPQSSRSFVSGIMGSAANVGFLLLGLIMLKYPATATSWRWVLALGAAALPLAWIAWRWVPESPEWFELRRAQTSQETVPVKVVLGPPWLKRTLLGIGLGTVPLLGGWASGQRLIPWAAQMGEAMNLPDLKAQTQIVQAMGAVLGSLSGGWLAAKLGPRRCYFFISLGSFLLSMWIFFHATPGQSGFLPSVFCLGFVATSFYGWLPYFLPGLFPTSIRATGMGVCYNSGRIFSAIVLFTSAFLAAWFEGDVGKMGAATSVIYLAGISLAWWIPRGDADARPSKP